MPSEWLKRQADYWMERGPFSVVHKTALTFSQDPHDYVSLGLYWWPDGRDYRRRDGVPNPETQGPKFDRGRLKDFNLAVPALALAAHLLGEEKYGRRAAEFVRVWFLEPATCMAPHLNYAQMVPGTDRDGLGIIDTFHFWSTLDAIDVLIGDRFLNDGDAAGLRAWFGAFVLWLQESRQGKSER